MPSSPGRFPMSPKSRRLPLSLPRRYMCDLLHFAQKVPAARVQRRMQLAAVVAARQAAAPRPAWCVIFAKALGFVAAARPELRRAYMGLPWPHLYEHRRTVVTMAIERQFKNEDGVFHAYFRSPEEKGLQELDALLRRYQEESLPRIGSFRRALRISRL